LALRAARCAAAMDDEAAAAAFSAAYGAQLDAAAFPRALFDTLRHKLTHEARAGAGQCVRAGAFAG
jgi:hypothetical protein